MKNEVDFEDVVDSGGELTPYWETSPLQFTGDCSLSIEKQKEILTHYLLDCDTLEEACRLSGVNRIGTIRRLEECIPSSAEILKKRFIPLIEPEIDLKKNREHVLALMAQCIQRLNRLEVASELEFQSGAFDAKTMKDQASAWAVYADRILPLLTEGPEERELGRVIPFLNTLPEDSTFVQIKERMVVALRKRKQRELKRAGRNASEIDSEKKSLKERNEGS